MNKTETKRILAAVRDLMPAKAISLGRAYFIAEQQAQLLIRQLGIKHSPVDVGRFGRLPRVSVSIRPREDMDGQSSSSRWHQGKWDITVCGDDPLEMRRYNLAREIKRVLDRTTSKVVYAGLRCESEDHYRQRIDSICDHFAACLLVPGRVLRRVWAAGLQDVACLAELFRVPLDVIRRRIAYLGLVDHDAEMMLDQIDEQLPLAMYKCALGGDLEFAV